MNVTKEIKSIFTKPFKYVFLILALYICLNSCNSVKENRLELSLREAGANRGELEKVLKRYSKQKSDSLKYRAACFLIENMPGYYFYDGGDLENYSSYFEALNKSNKKPEEILDSLRNIYGTFDISKSELKFDIEEIDSSYLCDNIDLSFAVRKRYPWARNVSFDDFCQYILPYRIGNEKLTNWRKDFLNSYKSLLDTTFDSDPVNVAKKIRDAILKSHILGSPRFTMIRPYGYPNLDGKTIKNFNGSCNDIAHFSLFVFRALGIPCAVDYTPVRGDDNSGHSWVVFKSSKSEYYDMDFFGDINYIGETVVNRLASKAKVYRKTYSKDIKAFERLNMGESYIPEEFSEHNYRFVDVTSLYSNKLTNFVVPNSILHQPVLENKVVYLCMSKKMNWIPVAWTRNVNGQISFDNVEIGSIFRLAYFDNKSIKYLTDPFYHHNQSREIRLFTVDSKKGSTTLFSKYSLYNDIIFRDRMVGGVLEAADNLDFKNADTLYRIQESPHRLITNARIQSKKKYRFVRYKAPYNSFCNIAELEFLSNTITLTGTPIGASGAYNNEEKYGFASAFDGKTQTSFDHNTASDGWVGLDLGKPYEITQIRYSPRNYDNYIQKQQTYELFIANSNGWKSLGKKTSSSDSLTYSNVPTQGLFYLKNHSSGTQERMFVMEEGKQIFK